MINKIRRIKMTIYLVFGMSPDINEDMGNYERYFVGAAETYEKAKKILEEKAYFYGYEFKELPELTQKELFKINPWNENMPQLGGIMEYIT